jgi:hypothetical protein
MESAIIGTVFLESDKVWRDIIPVPEGPVNYLEIGAHSGANIVSFSKSYGSHPESKLYCIDPWEDSPDYPENKNCQDVNYKNFIHNIKNNNIESKVVTCRGFSNIEIPKLDDNFFDIIYIDGNHTPEFVLEDAVLSFRKLKKGGYLIFDDFNFEGVEGPKILAGPNGTTRGIEAFLNGYKNRVEVLGLRWFGELAQVYAKKV